MVILVSILLFVGQFDARGIRRGTQPLLEFGPKASLYIGEDIAFGIGAEVVTNPVRNFGVRLDIAELRFGDNTIFYLNYGTSIDALIYIPMQEIEPYIHAGMGFSFQDLPSPVDNLTTFSIRFGMGFLFSTAAKTNLFIEPGILIEDTSGHDTKAIFRLSFGARFGVL